MDTPWSNPSKNASLTILQVPSTSSKGSAFNAACPPVTAERNITWSEEAFFHHNFGRVCPDHCRVEKQPTSAEELAQTIEAACDSCVEEIRYCGTDPEVLARFKELGYERLCDAFDVAR